MIRNSLLAAGLVSVGLVLVTPSIALAGPPQPVGPLVAATSLPIGPGVIVDPPKPPKPPVHPPIGPGVIVDATKPPKPPVKPPVGPDVIIDDVDPTTPPTRPAGPDDVTGNPPCPTHGTCGGDDPGETPDEEQTPTTDPTPTTPADNPGAGSGTSGGGLPVTGASVGIFVGLGLLLAAGGALLLLLARRRQVSPR